jgi:hypothetical protein
MVRAILEGRKTQTRRVIVPQPGGMEDDRRRLSVESDALRKGRPGDLLWVRESFWMDQSGGVWVYRAGTLNVPNPDWPPSNCGGHGVPSIHMPRWASRLTLRITSVIVHKIQQIGDDEIMAEGIIAHDKGGEPRIGRIMYAAREGNHCEWELTGRAAFARLWDSINAKRGYSWESNPWVWAITFERVV